MSSNSTNINSDDLAQGGLAAGVVIQAMLVNGIVGNALCIVVFLKQKNKSNKLQAAIMVSEMLNCLSYTASACDVYFFNFATNKKTPYALAGNYVIMFYVCHFMFPITNTFNTTTIFLLLVICIDRIVAIGKPFFYNHINEKRRSVFYTAVILISFGFGMSLSVFDCFRWYPEYQHSLNVYHVKTDIVYAQSIFATFSNFFRIAVRIIGSLFLIIGNSVVLHLYKKSHKSAVSEAKREHSEAIKLLIVQSVLTLVGHFFLNSYFFILFVYPWITQTLEYDAYRMGTSIFVFASPSLGFAIFLSVCKEFRGKCFAAFTCTPLKCLDGLGCKQRSSVQPAGQHTLRSEKA